MKKSLTTVNEETAVKVDKFDIDWPDLLKIEPIMKVEVTPTRSAYVYDDKQFQVRDRNGDVAYRNGYRIMFVVTKTGLPPIKQQRYYSNGAYGTFFESLLDVRYSLIDYSQANRPRVVTENQKVKRVVGTEEYEED